MPAIGIDFGSSYSTVSWINPHNGKPEAVKFHGDGSVKMPSTIFAVRNGFLWGFQAEEYLQEISLTANPTERMELLANFIPSLKRVLGPDEHEWFYGRDYPHPEILQLFFQNLISQTRLHCGSKYEIDEITISHPVDFPACNIELLKNSLSGLGFSNVRTQYEPISAVKGYAIDHDIQENEGVLVFDFGGGTIDVAFVQKRFGELVVAAKPKGNSNCGGQDIDMALYKNLQHLILNEFSYNISMDGCIDQSVLNACRRLKEKFSWKNDSYETKILLPISGHLKTYTYRLGRESFNAIISPIVAEAIHIADDVIQDVKNKGLTVNRVLLIGGSSQLNLVRDLLRAHLDDDVLLDTCGEKDIVVALGNISDATERDGEEEVHSSVEKENVIPFPSKEPLDSQRSISCKRCKSERCYHFLNKHGYHCNDCGWEGLNVIITYK